MKKFAKVIAVTAVCALWGSISSFAGEWKSDTNGWWYAKDDGSYVVSDWLADNGKMYYFNVDGYMVSNTWVGNYYVGNDGAMLTNTTTPDGYYVGRDGAWVEGGKPVTEDMEYLEKYAEVLREMPVPTKNIVSKFILAYIDEDTIPELIIIPGEFKPELYLYTYYQGNVKMAGKFYYGTVLNYVEKGNLIYSDCFQTGMNQWDGFYRIENGERIAIAEFYSSHDDPGLSLRFYEMNQQEVSESTYRSQLNAMKGGYSFKTIEYNAYHKINEENIKKMLADMSSAM